MWGSAFAASLDDICLKVVGIGLGFLDSFKDVIKIVDDCRRFHFQDPTRLKTRLVTPGGPLLQIFQDFFKSRVTCGETFNFMQGLYLHKDYVNIKKFVAWRGTHLDAFPNQLTPMEESLYLVDGGFSINSPFPLVLQPERDVDVILSFNFSWEAPFEVLELTQKYCEEREIPFPKIKLSEEDEKKPKECYMFVDDNNPKAPIVLHFPLVNDTFQKYKAPGVKRESEEEKSFGDFVIESKDSPYRTLNFTFEPYDFSRSFPNWRYMDTVEIQDWFIQANPHRKIGIRRRNHEKLQSAEDEPEVPRLCWLTVKIISMRNLRRADLLSLTDCYVKLRLPTASCRKARTRTVRNCRNPVWNETFHFMIQSEVKNILELTVCDEDTFTPDDQLLTVCFDVAKIRPGEKVHLNFELNPEGESYEVSVKEEDGCKNLDLRLGFDLCTEEQDFICKRKKVVAAALKNVLQLDEDLQEDEGSTHKLSDQQLAVNQGQNPLPIYLSLNVKDDFSTLDFKEWVEFTPYEVGFLKYGAFVRSEDFGSEFFMGHLMKKIPESRVCFLEDTVLDSSPNQLIEMGDYLKLVDTAFFINTSCPPILRPERKVDVILHLNYSGGSQTLPLDLFSEYCLEHGIPFPGTELSQEDREHLKECYVFEDSLEAPILAYFPLVCDTFQKYKAPNFYGHLSTSGENVTLSDCYVTLWLPTASTEKVRTRTIRNSKNPVWNEAFCYKIDRRVKNVLELKVCDEDTITRDDELCTVLFDIDKLTVGRTVRVKFQLNPQAREELEVEFTLQNTNYEDNYNIEEVLTFRRRNAKPKYLMLSLLWESDFPNPQRYKMLSYQELTFTVKGSHEGSQKILLDSDPSLKIIVFHCVINDQTRLDIILPEEVPVVAITTTGGGTRSLTAMYGSLLGLQKLNLLDCISYIGGLSGTTWTMANLYEDANWSQKYLEDAIKEARKQVTKSKICCFSLDCLKYYYNDLMERTKEGHNTSFIDLWGLVIESMLHDKKDEHRLSDQRQAVDNGQNPLPIYVAINLKSSYSAQAFRVLFCLAIVNTLLPFHDLVAVIVEWLEFTPYEVSLLKYGASIRAEHFGSEFFMGRLVKKLSETRICYMQDTVIDSLPNKLMETADDELSLVDTGFFINTSYPPLLRSKREVDVILHLNYSGGSQTLPLDQIAKYISGQGIPFPKIEISEEDRENLKECYVFEDADSPQAPTVLFFPLVNDTFKKYKAPGVERNPEEMAEGKVDVSSILSPFTTREVCFSEENFDKLVKLTDYNVLNNEKLIIRALRLAVARRKQRNY
ncbi:cytosolic phospholipase A2 zeta [Grus japonensis]|uniref:Phospholipase A2 n=1 Tax=Grus japonensis TaxID=30415 RepID=A0ABC9WZ03_GRUJA